MLSRVPITSEISQVPFLISSCALPVQTSVPWERPEICNRSEKVFGCASKSIWQTNEVPISGIDSVPVFQAMSSSVTPSGSGLVQRRMICGSQTSTSITGIPVKSSKWRYSVGTSWPRISNFKIVSCKEWKSKCVVSISPEVSSAGNCTGVKSQTSYAFGTTTMPPGCCPVVRLTPVHPSVRRCSSARLTWCPRSSKYFFT